MRRGVRSGNALALCVLVLLGALWPGQSSQAGASDTVWSDTFWFSWQARVVGDQGDGIFRTQIWFYLVDESEGGVSGRERIQNQGDLMLNLDLMAAEQYGLTYADDLFSLELVDPASDARLPIRNLSRPLYELYDRALDTGMLYDGLPNTAPETLEAYTANLAARLNRDARDPAFQAKTRAWYALMQGPLTARESRTGFVVEMVSALRLPESVAAAVAPVPQPTTAPAPKADAADGAPAKQAGISCPKGALRQMFITKHTPIDVRLYSGTKQLNLRQSVKSLEDGGLEAILTVYGTPTRYPEIRVECTEQALQTLESLGVKTISVHLDSPAGVHPFQRWVEHHTLEQLKAKQ